MEMEGVSMQMDNIITRVNIFIKNSERCRNGSNKNQAIHHIAGKSSREKTFAFFAVSESSTNVFSVKLINFGGMVQ